MRQSLGKKARGPDGPAPPNDSSSLIPGHLFYLSPTGGGRGLVVEQLQSMGGALKVYTF